MTDRVLMSIKRNWGALKIAAVYLVIGSLWILFSDRVAESLTKDPTSLATLSTFKGWGYVILTALLLYGLIRRHTAALRESEEKYRTLVESADDAILSETLTGEVVSWNAGAARLYGYTAAEMRGRSVSRLMSPDQIKDLEQILERVAQGESIHHYDTTRRTKDGRIVNVSLTVSPIKNAAGQVTGASTIVRDITAHKQVEIALQESEERFRQIFENMSSGVVVYEAVEGGQDFKINHFNRAAEKIESLSRDSVLGRTVCEAFPGVKTFGLLDVLQRVWETGHPERFPLGFYQDNRIAGWRENYIARLPSGEVMAIYDDVTERKRAEEEVVREQTLMHALLDNVPDSIYFKDTQSRFIRANLALVNRLGVANVDQVLGKTDFDFFTPEHSQAAYADEQAIIYTGQPIINREEKETRPQRPPAWVLSTKMPLRDSTGAIIGTFGISRDISERLRLESELRDKVATLQTLAEIDREIIAATKPEGVLELVCRSAAELIHAPKSAIAVTSTENKMIMTASYGLHDPVYLAEELTRAWQSGSMGRRILSTHETIALQDISFSDTAIPEVGRKENIRALALVPLMAGERALGALSVFDSAPHPWTDNELQTLRMLANQAAVALEKLRLFQAARSRALQLTALNEISQALTSSLDLDQVLITLLEKVRLTTEAEGCSVALVERESGDLVFRQAVGGDVAAVIGLRLQPGQGLVGWVAQHGQSLLVTDAAADPRTYQVNSHSGFVTHELIGVPLIARDTVTGVLELVNKRNGHFGEDDVRLLESAAGQAAIVIENARLFETERTGRQRLETLYRIGQAINSTLDADAILDRLTDEAMQVTLATHGSALVVRSERGVFERRSLRGYSPEQVEKARTAGLPLDRGVNGRAYRLQQAVYIDDVRNDPDYHPLISQTRSELAVPIVRGGQVIGNLDLQSPVVNAFRDVDLQFLKALTDQVAIALENARLFEETRRQMEELTIVSHVALVGAAGRPFDETVARATDMLSRLWPHVSLGFLFVDETGQALRMHPSYLNPVPGFDPLISLPLDQGLIGWAARQRQPLRVGDVTQDPRYVAKATDIRSEMVAPLVVGERVIGVVNVETPWLDAFSGDDLRLLTTLAGQLAVIFEKAHLDAALIEHAALLEERVQERTAEIRREQARTQAILDALGEGVVVTDLQSIIQYTNPAMEWVTGFSSSESLGQTPSLWQSGQTPREVYQDLWQTILTGRTWHGEVVNRRKDGALYEASLAVAPIPTTSGDPGPFAGFVGIQRDITERKLAEAALRESEALYHSLVEVMPLSLCRKDLAGRFTFANQRFLAEVQESLADFIGRTDFDIHPPEQAEKYRRDDQRVIATGQIVEAVEERTVLGGEMTFVQTVKAPITNSAGEISGVQIAFWDVTDRIRAEEEMRHALEQERELNNLKSRFVSLTSHEFRTPLTVILSSAEMLEHYHARWTEDRRREYFRRIKASVKYMTNLLNDILIIGKVDAGKLEFMPAPLDLLQFCRELVEEMQLTDQAKHSLVFTSTVEWTQTHMDERLLRHILTNLLSNAFKYSPPGSVVAFELTGQNDQAVFRIQDQGIGIPLEDQARLFETFHRASNVRTIAGTGLGLAIVKRSVDLHGGTLAVVSQVDVGTTVTVVLPTSVT